MKVTRAGGSLAVRVGETFGVERTAREAFGFQTRIAAPSGVDHLGTDRPATDTFGGSPVVVERFRCERAGRFVIEIDQARPWETAQAGRFAVTILCTAA